MREVKKEVYGSRKSVLAGLFLDNGIQYIHNIWFLTCRAEINQNIKTRYLVLVENDDTINTGIFKSYVPIFRFVKSNKKALITDLRNGDQILCNSKREIRQ